MRAPRWLGLLTALLALGGGSGCPAEPIPCFPGSEAPRQGVPVIAVGTEARFDVVADLSRACDVPNSPRQPESVTVEVKDPENQPVPATAELTGNGRGATIRFTPTVRGRHHVIVAFAPVGSLHQLGVFAGDDRRKEAPLASLPPSLVCGHLDRTTRGTWLCGSTALREPTDEPQQLASAQAPSYSLVAGDVVWTLAGDQVLRYVDTGTGPLELTGTAPHPNGPAPGSFRGSPHSRLAMPDELLMLSDSLLHRYTFTEADGISTAPTTAWVPSGVTSFGGDSVNGLLVRAGARVLVVTRVSDPRTFEPRTQACPFRYGQGGALERADEAPCDTLAGAPVGYEEGVVWTSTRDFTGGTTQEVLRRYTAASGRLLEEGALTLDGQLIVSVPSLRAGPVIPHLAPFGLITPIAGPHWDAAQGRVELVLLPGPPGSNPHLGPRFLWLDNLSQSGGTWVYPWESTR